jgi:hypothetical protein
MLTPMLPTVGWMIFGWWWWTILDTHGETEWKNSNVANTLKPVRLAPTIPRSKALKYFVLPIYPQWHGLQAFVYFNLSPFIYTKVDLTGHRERFHLVSRS